MADPYETFVAGQREFGDRVHAIGDDQWRLPTPCAEWTVADLVRHLVDEHRWAGPLARGQQLAAARPADDTAGDLTAAWDVAARRSADAFAVDGALDRTVDLTRGPAPAREYLSELTVDLVVHAWDLGRAIGHRAALPDDLAAAVQDEVESAVTPYGTMFAVPIEVPDDALLIDRLVARTGRDPDWSAP